MLSRHTPEQLTVPEEKSFKQRGGDVLMILLILALLTARAGSGIFNVFKFNERVQHVITGNSDSNSVRSVFDILLGIVMLLSVSAINVVSRGFTMYRNHETKQDNCLQAKKVEIKQSPDEINDVMEIKPVPAAFNPTCFNPGIQSSSGKRHGYRWTQFFNNFYVWTGSGPSAILSVGSVIKLLQLSTKFKFDSTCSKDSSQAWEIGLAHLATFFVFAANVYSFKTYNTEAQRMYYKDMIIRKRVFEQKDSFIAACKKLMSGDWRSFLKYFQADELFPDSQLQDKNGKNYITRNSRLYPEHKLEDGILLDKDKNRIQVRDNKIQNSFGLITLDDMFLDKNKKRVHLINGKFYVEEEDPMHESGTLSLLGDETKHAVTKSAWHAISMIDRIIVLGGTSLSSLFIFYSESILIEEFRNKSLCHIHSVDKPSDNFMTLMSILAAFSNFVVILQMTAAAVYNREEAKRLRHHAQEENQDKKLTKEHDEQEAKKVFSSKMQKFIIKASIIMNAVNMFMGTFVALGSAPEKMSHNKTLSDSVGWNLSITLLFAFFSFMNQKALDEEAVEREKLARYRYRKELAERKQSIRDEPKLLLNGIHANHETKQNGQGYAPLEDHIEIDDVPQDVFEVKSNGLLDNIKQNGTHDTRIRLKDADHYDSLRKKLYSPRMFTSASSPSNFGDDSDADVVEFKAGLGNSIL